MKRFVITLPFKKFREEWGLVTAKKTWKQQLGSFLVILPALTILTVTGVMVGYHWGTGELPPPFMQSQRILPPAPEVTTTQEQVVTFMSQIQEQLKPYGNGFNCVEAALLCARNASWAGIDVAVFQILGEGSINHMVLGFPTSDTGWTFIDPVGPKIIDPWPGTMFYGEKIKSLDVLTMIWEPFIEGENS